MIYFLQPLTGGAIKIGFTDNLEARRTQLEAHYGQPLALLATRLGGRDEERAIHERFAHLRLGRTEQFRPTSELLAYIGRPLLVSPNPDAVEASPRKRSGERRFNTLVRMDDELCETARKLALARGVSMAEMFAEMLRPIVAREWAKEVEREWAKQHGKIPKEKEESGG